MSNRENVEDDDVIELGEDGTFDITLPKKTKSNVNATKVVETKQTTPIIRNDKVEQTNPNILPDELLNSVPIGEYKVFTSPNSKESFLIIHLQSSEVPKQVRLVNHEIKIEFNEYSLSVDIKSLNIDESSIHTSSWRDFLSFRFLKLSQ